MTFYSDGDGDSHVTLEAQTRVTRLSGEGATIQKFFLQAEKLNYNVDCSILYYIYPASPVQKNKWKRFVTLS